MYSNDCYCHLRLIRCTSNRLMVVNRSASIHQFRKNDNGFSTSTMNYWQIHVAAKKRGKARRDILALLKNSYPRPSKTKKTQPVSRKQFGIFARAISFKVVREEADELNDEQSPNRIEKTTDRMSRPRKRTEGKRNLTPKNHGFVVIDSPRVNQKTMIIQNNAKVQPQKINPSKEAREKRRPEPSKKDTGFEVLQEKVAQGYQHAPKHRNNNDSRVHNNNDELNDFNTPADFKFDGSPKTNGISHRILSFHDSLIEPNFENEPNVIGSSIGFNELGNQIGAGHSNSLADFCENISNNRNILKGISIEIQTISLIVKANLLLIF